MEVKLHGLACADAGDGVQRDLLCLASRLLGFGGVIFVLR